MNSTTSIVPRTQNCMVIEGLWSVDHRMAFRTTLRDAVPGSPQGDLLVLTRIMLRILESRALTRFRPVVSLNRDRPSLWQAAVLDATKEESAAFGDISDEMALEAANLARWVIGLPQQVCIYPLVFVSDEDVLPDDEEEST